MTPLNDRVCDVLSKTQFNFTTEAELQDGVALALTRAGIPFAREHRLDAHSRIDFFFATTPGLGIGLECKVAGSFAEIVRQVHRYAQHPAVDALIVLSRRANAAAIPDVINNKPVRVITLWSNGL